MTATDEIELQEAKDGNIPTESEVPTEPILTRLHNWVSDSPYALACWRNASALCGCIPIWVVCALFLVVSIIAFYGSLVLAYYWIDGTHVKEVVHFKDFIKNIPKVITGILILLLVLVTGVCTLAGLLLTSFWSVWCILCDTATIAQDIEEFNREDYLSNAGLEDPARRSSMYFCWNSVLCNTCMIIVLGLSIILSALVLCFFVQIADLDITFGSDDFYLGLALALFYIFTAIFGLICCGSVLVCIIPTMHLENSSNLEKKRNRNSISIHTV